MYASFRPSGRRSGKQILEKTGMTQTKIVRRKRKRRAAANGERNVGGSQVILRSRTRVAQRTRRGERKRERGAKRRVNPNHQSRILTRLRVRAKTVCFSYTILSCCSSEFALFTQNRALDALIQNRQLYLRTIMVGRTCIAQCGRSASSSVGRRRRVHAAPSLISAKTAGR